MRARSIIAILLIAVVTVPAVAQEEGPPWEVRPYLSTYTDASLTWNFTATRHRFICSYCGYSMTHTDTDAVASDYVCPNPFGLAGHDNFALTEATPRQRVLSELSVASEDAAGNASFPLVGRPFHPGRAAQPEWNADPSPWTADAWDALALDDPAFRDQASYMTLRAANLNADGLISGDGNAGSDGLRFMVLKPGAVRPAARLKYRDINEDEFAHDEPRFYRTTVASGTPDPDVTAEDYTIRVNPYRVSDGDVFYIWHYERCTAVGDPPTPATTGVAVEVYSTLYGKDFDSDPEATGGMGNLTAENLVSYYTENGMRIFTDSGALRIDIPRRFVAGGEGRWVIRVEIQSNTTILPRPEEVNYDDVHGEDRYTALSELAFPPGEDLTGFTAAGPAWKQSFVWANTAASPVTLATADADTGDTFDVAEKALNGSGFTTDEIWPYRVPPEAAGRGRVMVQWSEAAADADLEWGGVVAPDTRPIFFNTGREWHYVVDPDSPTTRLVTNQQAAARDTLPDDRVFIDSYFMCSRLQVDHDMRSAHYLGNDAWMNSRGTDRTGELNADIERATGGHPHLILGSEQDLDAWGGEYNPGTRTPSRQFTVANRTPVRVSHCPVDDDGCGTRFRRGEQHRVGDECPVCGEAELLATRAEARVQYDAPGSLWSGLGARMTGEALRFGLSGAMVPIGARDFLQEAFADIPAYQPPSVPAGATTFANSIDNDQPYHGTMLAFHRPDYEGQHYDTNTTWDAYFLAPESGMKFPTPETIGITAGQAQWECSVCASPYSRSVGNRCGFCRNPLNIASDLPTPLVPYESLVAEEYAPFDVQVSVLRKAALAANRRVVDLGWVAPGISAEGAWPSNVSDRSDLPARNEGNINLPTRMRSTPLLQTGVDSAVRSEARVGQSVPITLRTLFRYRQGPVQFGAGDWRLLRQEATGAAGQLAGAMIQAGTRGDTGEPYEGVFKPVPLGQPLGNYSTEVLLFADTTGDGVLHFHSPIYGHTNTGVHEFNPDIDEPYEPVVSFATRARVVETRLPQSGFFAQDLMPTLLHDPGLDNLQVLWVRQGAEGGGAAPLNILYANAESATDDNDPLYRDWRWADPDTAEELTSSDTANDRHTSPTAYLDQDGGRWAMWHRSLTTQAGVSSRLQFADSTGTTWAADPNDYIFGTTGARGGLTGFVREGADLHWQLWQAGPQDREQLRYRWEWDPTSGVVPSDERLMVSNTSTGQRGDTFGTEVEVDGEIEHWRYRKPALDPFTYVREPSAWGRTNDDGDQFLMDVVFTGHIRSLGHSDICWARFNFGNPADEDFPFNTAADNFGKIAFPRVVGSTYEGELVGSTDARRMPAIRGTDRTVLGYAGEQLTPSPRRQSYQARDIDWLVTRAKPVGAEAPFNFETAPDWIDWATAGEDTEIYDDPMFYVAVVTREDDAPAQQVLYAVDWSQGSYDTATGLYTVLPRLVRLATATSDFAELHDPEEAGVAPVWHPFDDGDARAVYWRQIDGDVHAKALLAPSARGAAMAVEDGDPWDDATFAETWPAVTLTVNPASGMVRWSSPLFNPDVPSDRTAVFNSDNTENIVDVVMYADYTPFIRRVTTDSADDDSPSAFWNEGDSGRMSVFWRRSYGDTDAPHFGRPSFMHRTYTRAIQVGRPHIQSDVRVVVMDLTLEPNAADTNVEFTELSLDNGVIEIESDPATSPSRIGHRIAVRYQDADGTTRTEHHRVVGWSLETPVPINAVTSEGPVRVTPEVYTVEPDAGQPFETVRYWLTWSSPRGVFDHATAVGDGGQRVHQSSDVYVAVVATDHSSLIADIEVPRLEP